MRDVYFNKEKFSFEKEETEAVFFHAALFNKMERRHRMTKCKANFCKLKENTKKYGNKVLTIRTQLSEPLSTDKNKWFQNVYFAVVN